MKTRFVCMLLMGILAMSACSSDDPSDPSGSNNSDSNRLFASIKQTTPVFEASAAKAEFSNQAMAVAFQLLRDYTYPDDEGVVDMSNIYKVLWETGGRLDEAPLRCETLAAAVDQDISPFAFDDAMAHTYTMGMSEESGGYGTSIAYGVDGDDELMLVSYKWAPDATEQVTIGVIQARYNETSGDLDLRFAQSVLYPAGSAMGGAEGNGFAIRASILGNSTTHAFELKMAINGTSLVGKGVSRGEGNYFLFRSGDDYYCVPAEATEDELAALTATDLANVPAEGAAYKTAVSAMTAYDVATDLPAVDLSDFDGGTDGAPVNYLMF